jgi:hypothetical protein
VIVSQALLLTATQEQVPPVVTLTVPVDAAAVEKARDVDESP